MMIGPTLMLRRNDARTIYLDVTLPPAPFPVQDLNDFTSIRFTIKRDEDDPDASLFLQKTKAAGQITIEAATPPLSGTLAIAIAAGDLNEKGNFVWDVEVRDPENTIMSGNLIVNADVTIDAP